MPQDVPRSSLPAGDDSRQAGFPALCTVGFFAFLSYEWARTPMLSLYANSLGASEDLVGAVMAASTFTGIFFKYPSGILSDIFGRRALLLIGAWIFGVTPFLYAFIHTVPLLMTVRLFHGLATAIFAPVSLAMVADMFQTRRAESIGWYTAFSRTGRTLGPYLGGLILAYAGFQSSFLLCGVSGMIALVFAFRLRNPLPSAVPHQPWRYFVQRCGTGLKEAAANLPALGVTVITAAEMFALGTVQAFLPLYGALHLGLREDQIGLLFALQGLSSLMTRPIMGRASDRFGRKILILIGMVVTALALALIPETDTFFPLAALSTLFGLGEAIVLTSASAFMADLSGGRSMGSAMGILGSVTDIGHAAGQFVPGLAIVLFGYAFSFSAVAAFLLLFALAVLFFAPSRPGAG